MRKLTVKNETCFGLSGWAPPHTQKRSVKELNSDCNLSKWDLKNKSETELVFECSFKGVNAEGQPSDEHGGTHRMTVSGSTGMVAKVINSLNLPLNYHLF